MIVGFLFFLSLTVGSMYAGNRYLISRYEKLQSPRYEDRNGVVLSEYLNGKGAYSRYRDTIPDNVADFIVRKEDRFFFLHAGINPVSTARSAFRHALGHRTGGGSTITQQLVKNLLGNEQNRTFTNKFIETLFALDLEIFASKRNILTMYANTVYMGNQVQGLDLASELYFKKKLENLDDTKLAILLGTLSSPTIQNPWREENATVSRNLAVRLGITFDPTLAIVTDKRTYYPARNLELDAMKLGCLSVCRTTLDADLMDRLRATLEKNVERGWDAGARSGAIIVIDLPENNLLAIIGTPDQNSTVDGQQIDMAIEPRAIGSTAKPFIYLRGFEKGLRPYTLVNDREYKFPIGSGFPLYPKNYDGQYRGWVTLHAALSNSLNVPTVQTLKFIGLEDFYGFLEHKLGFKPERDLDEYQYGIALGALEMDPLTLAHLLTIFPAQGALRPLKLFTSGTSSPFITTPMSRTVREERVSEPKYTQLVTKVLNDRLTGVNQFGLVSSLNLPRTNYAVKTGTSQDYHDSWTVGYTPDYLVAVWFGNPDNSALRHVTGQTGAGSIWHDAMQLLMNSNYDNKTPFDFSEIRNFDIQKNIDAGLKDDVISEHQNLLPDDTLIVSPQDGDTFLSEARTAIPLVASVNVSWFSDAILIGRGTRILFYPSKAGDFTIKAKDSTGHTAQLVIHVVSR